MHPFLEELEWRGLLHQVTSDALSAHLSSGVRTGYAGFDPTAPSLTIGNYIPIKILAHFQRSGHRPIALMGGATGLIGDPSGKSAERKLLDRDTVESYIAAQSGIFERVLDFSGSCAATVANNDEWLGSLGYIDVLRDVGKHFSVNAMIQKESVRARLQEREQGISYTEFSYMILQAYDFLHLHRERGVTVQLGGSDQYGNIVAGLDLIRRLDRDDAGTDDAQREARAFGITNHLVTRSDGGKIGKTEHGAIWLTADRTSPYEFHQFWLNTPDTDVVRFLKWFTFESRERIAELETATTERPHERAAQQVLADSMTDLIHGETERTRAVAASRALFSGAVRELDEALLDQVFADVASSSLDRARLAGDGLSLLDLLPETTLAQSRREAREFLQNGAVSVNGEKVALDATLRATDLLHGRTILLRRGKKAWHAVRVEG